MSYLCWEADQSWKAVLRTTGGKIVFNGIIILDMASINEEKVLFLGWMHLQSY